MARTADDGRGRGREVDPPSTSVLVVDENPEIRRLVSTWLNANGFEVVAADGARAALVELGRRDLDIALVDDEVGGTGGVALMERFSLDWPGIAVIFVTARPELSSALAALRCRAVEYLCKPLTAEKILRAIGKAMERLFRTRLVDSRLSCLSALLERLKRGDRSAGTGSGSNPLTAGDLRMDLGTCEAWLGSSRLSLTPTEFRLLAFMMLHRGQVLEHLTLARQISERRGMDRWQARELVKHYVHKLRRKLEPDHSKPRYVHTVRGRGYKLDPPGR